MVLGRVRAGRGQRIIRSDGSRTLEIRHSEAAPAQLDGISAAQTQGRKMGIPCTVSETGIIT